MIRMGVVLLCIGAVLAFYARSVHWLIYWPAGNFFILASAYFTSSHRVIGKRSDGTLPWWPWIFFAPYLLVNYTVWHLVRLISREAKFVQITDRLTVGRRLLNSEAPVDFDNYVDLTAEFAEPAAIRALPGYVCIPMLDAGCLSAGRLQEEIAGLRAGRTYVHCAQGHGRTGLFAALLLLNDGIGKSVDDALAMLRAKRPGIRLKAGQRACAEAFAANLQSATAT